MQRVAAADRAYEVTKELVLSGELPGGRLLSEGEIADRLGLSRTPVREAFLRLNVEGFLTLIPKRGAVVVPVSPEEADDILDAREAIEAAAVRRLVRRPDQVPTVVAELRRIVEEQRGHLVSGDVAGFAEVDELFHRGIVDAGRNALTCRFYATLAERQRRMTVRALAPDPALMPAVVAQHEQLVALIAALDVDGFVGALRAHLDGTHRR